MLFEGVDLGAPVSIDIAIPQGLMTTVLGMVVVFLALTALILLTWIMSKAIRATIGKKSAPVAAPAVAVAGGAPAPAAFANRGEAVAAISAAIAATLGTTSGGFRIHSITPTGESNRGETVAAISAAIAETMGKTDGGLRIHSITKV